MAQFKKKDKGDKIRSNEGIRVPEVRLIGAAAEQIGVVSIEDALERAREQGLDLVEVAPDSKPPVCKIMDLGKYLYSLSKKEKEAKKKQKVFHVKEIKMTCKIDEHDYETKLKNARRFIQRGDKVKFGIFFRGREIVYADRGKQLAARFKEDLSDIAEVERDDGLEGKMLNIYFTPMKKTGKKKAAPVEEAPKEKATKE